MPYKCLGSGTDSQCGRLADLSYSLAYSIRSPSYLPHKPMPRKVTLRAADYRLIDSFRLSLSWTSCDCLAVEAAPAELR